VIHTLISSEVNSSMPVQTGKTLKITPKKSHNIHHGYSNTPLLASLLPLITDQSQKEPVLKLHAFTLSSLLSGFTQLPLLGPGVVAGYSASDISILLAQVSFIAQELSEVLLVSSLLDQDIINSRNSKMFAI
jgi:hypothetical protein